MNHFTKIAILAVLAIALSVAVTMRAQPVKAFAPPSCSQCAKDFAPGQEAKNSDQSASTFAPGQEKKSIPVPCSICNGASQFAPGQEKNQGSTSIIGP